MIGPANRMNPGHKRPSSNESTVPDTAADGEQDRRSLGPALRQLVVDLVLRDEPAPLRYHHEHRHPDPDERENDVEREGDPHLRAGSEEVGHGNQNTCVVRGAWLPAVRCERTVRTVVNHAPRLLFSHTASYI